MKKSYYAIIPANVRYDKQLTPNAKLLYGEITALANEKGYCWANNSYFAELYEVSKETVSRWISKLEQSGYIKTKLIYHKGTKSVKERRIYMESTPIDENINTPIDKNIKGYRQKHQDPIDKNINTPIDENVKDNTTSFNNTSNTTENIELQKNCNDEEALKFLDGDIEIELAKFMINEILRIKPDSKVPNMNIKSLQKWGQQIDYMIRLDKRTPKEITELFRWAQEDSFWVANIRSPRKLRSKWDTLDLQKNRDNPKKNNNVSKLERMYAKELAKEGGS